MDKRKDEKLKIRKFIDKMMYTNNEFYLIDRKVLKLKNTKGKESTNGN